MTRTIRRTEREKLLDPRFLLVLAIAVAIAFLSINEIAYHGARKAAAEDFTQQDRRFDLNQMTLALFSAQAHMRGYLLSDQQPHLDQYQAATGQVRAALNRLEEVSLGDATANKTLGQLREEVIFQLSEMELALRLHHQHKGEALQFLLGSERSTGLLETIAALRTRLLQQQAVQVAETRSTLLSFLSISRVGTASLTLTALVAFWLYLRQVRSRKAADMEIQRSLTRERDALERLVRQRTASLSELASYLQQVREHERSHLANELHDELGALLTAAKLDIARLRPRIDMGNAEIKERVTHLTETLNQVIALKRRIIEDLHPSSLNTLGLNTALENLTQEFTHNTGIPVESVHENLDVKDQALQLTIYRIVQESLNNIAKYAQASHVETYLHRYPSHLLVRIRDDGKGFDVNSVGTSTHGIRGMRHRIEALGGQLRVESTMGKGSTVTATIPLNATMLHEENEQEPPHQEPGLRNSPDMPSVPSSPRNT